MTNDNLRSMFERITGTGFTKAAGFAVRDFDVGRVTLEVVPKEELTQFMGYVHAGVVSGLADHAAGAAYASTLPEGKVCLTVELKINLLKPAEGEKLAAEARVVSAGGTIGVVQADVYGERGDERTHCATALVTLRSIKLGGRRG